MLVAAIWYSTPLVAPLPWHTGTPSTALPPRVQPLHSCATVVFASHSFSYSPHHAPRPPTPHRNLLAPCFLFQSYPPQSLAAKGTNLRAVKRESNARRVGIRKPRRGQLGYAKDAHLMLPCSHPSSPRRPASSLITAAAAAPILRLPRFLILILHS